MTMPAQLMAGRTAEESTIPFADLALYDESEQALAAAESIVAAIEEVRERLRVGLLGTDARYDVGFDLYELSSKIQCFALGVNK